MIGLFNRGDLSGRLAYSFSPPVDGRPYIDYSRYMDTKQAVIAFQALSQQSRVDALRLLVQRGDGGLLAGEIAALLGVRQNTMSSHLSILMQAGLVTNRREGRGVRYVADLAGLRSLLAFLLEDCCAGRAEICQPIRALLAC